VNEEKTRVAFIGDVHLDLGDAEVGHLGSLLSRLSDTCDSLVLMGDLFNLWIGQRELQQEHHREIAGILREIRDRGVELHYVEGNRDYRVGREFAGDLFDTAGDAGLVQRVSGRSLWAIHGDLANTRDKHYRRWRRLSRSKPFWVCFNLLPARLRARVAAMLETRMRGTNLAFKRDFPQAMVGAYAARFGARGYDAVVLGHFHIEKRWTLDDGTEVFVLPEWKGSRRHLIAEADGIRFVDSV
jgi:UDP-2,3-diacylglucosamine hydrolase